MNENYIAPEALDETIFPSCRHCSKTFSSIEEKIRFYQGDCPYCGLNPSVFQPNPKGNEASGHIAAWAALSRNRPLLNVNAGYFATYE